MPHLLAASSTRRRRRKRVARRRRRVVRRRKRVARKTARRRRVRRKGRKKKTTQPCQQAKRSQCFCSEGWSVSTVHTHKNMIHISENCKNGNNLTSGWNL